MTPINISSITTIKLRLQSGQWERVVCVIMPKLTDNFYLTWYSKKRLGILPHEWPYKNFKVRRTNVQVCLYKQSSPTHPKPIDPLKWSPAEW